MTKSRYYRLSDGAEVMADEAFAGGALRSGYRLHFGGAMLADANSMGTMMHDTAKTFMDAMPSPRVAQINAILTDIASNEVFRVQRAGDAAKELAWALEGMAKGLDPAIIADRSRAAYAEAAAYLHKVSDQAVARVSKLYSAAAAGDPTANVGGGDLIRDAALAAYTDRLGNAWRGPADPAPPTLTGDATMQDADNARAKMIANLGKAWEN